MRALYFSEHGGPDRLEIGARPRPQAGANQAVVRLAAAALNHLDLFVLGGLPGVPIALPHIGGADGAGTVEECGEGVAGWSRGDEVIINTAISCGECEACRRHDEPLCERFGVIGEHVDGTFAEWVVVPASALSPRPKHLSWAESGALGLTYLTAWRMLHTRARLVEGESLLIHGIGGGVALAALALAKAQGARVIVTSSSEDKLARARALGADLTINYKTADVGREIRALTAKRGVDVVVDSVGEATWMTSLRSVAKGGRIVTCGATSGPNPTEEIRLIFWKGLSILGSTMGGGEDWRAMLALVTERALRPVIDRVMPLAEGRRGYELLASGGHFGKVVLDISGAAGASGA